MAPAPKHRPKGDSPDEQILKEAAHRRAHQVIKQYIEEKNFIGAYVIAYSLLEDRIGALCVLIYRDVEKVEHWQDKLNNSYGRILRHPKMREHLAADLYQRTLQLMDERNKLLHAAMYNTDTFQEKHVKDIMASKEQFARVVKKLKRSLEKSAS